MTISDGGPAFPGPENELCYTPQGMSLRDYFAAKAMAGILVWDAIMNQKNGHPTYIGEGSAQRLAEHSYHTADAMLKARNAVTTGERSST